MIFQKKYLSRQAGLIFVFFVRAAFTAMSAKQICRAFLKLVFF